MTTKKPNRFELEAVKKQRQETYSARTKNDGIKYAVYTAPELLQQAARPGAMDAYYSLPSRVGKRLTVPGRGEVA